MTRKLEVKDQEIMRIAVHQEIVRSEQSLYDHRLHGIPLVYSGLDRSSNSSRTYSKKRDVLRKYFNLCLKQAKWGCSNRNENHITLLTNSPNQQLAKEQYPSAELFLYYQSS
jgi:hypothetical protein